MNNYGLMAPDSSPLAGVIKNIPTQSESVFPPSAGTKASMPSAGTKASDIIIRFCNSEIVTINTTASLLFKMQTHFDEVQKIVRVSDEAITSLRRNIDFNGYYISYLLHQISDDEFAKISEEYAIDLNSEETDELLDKIRVLFSISSQSFTSSELSTIFKIDESVSESILYRLKSQSLIESAKIENDHKI